MLSIETRFCDILVGYTQPVLRYCKFQVMRLQGHQPGSWVATHCHAPRLGRAAFSPRAAWPGGVCQGHTGTVDGWPWTAPDHETGSLSWTLVRLVVAARGFWSPKVMSVRKFWSPLVELHQWTSSLFIHASRFCNKNIQEQFLIW